MNVVLSVIIVRRLMFFNVQVRSHFNHYCPSVPRFAPVDQSDGKRGSIYPGKFQQKPADFQAESDRLVFIQRAAENDSNWLLPFKSYVGLSSVR
jgi:hypothetical protein